MARRSLSLLVLVAFAAAASEEVPPALALTVMLKVLTYDANFGTRGSGEFVILVPYAPGGEAHANEIVELAAQSPLRSINNRPLKFVALASSQLSSSKCAAVLLPPGSSSQAAREVVDYAAAAHLYTLAFDEALVRDGVMMAVGANSGKPQVVLNMATARSIGAELSASVLKVARTVQ
jgi:hypothetical protein